MHTCSVWSLDDRHWVNGAGWQSEFVEVPRSSHDAEAVGRGPTSPLPGTVIVVAVTEGQRSNSGQLLVVVEAMKMEHQITADTSGLVIAVRVQVDERVDAHQVLVEIEPERDDE